MSDIIEFQLVDTNVFTRWPCDVCDGCTEKVGVLCEAKYGHELLRVCETCLQGGQEKIDQTLEEHAARLELQARDTRRLIGRLRVPTYAEWEQREATYDARSDEALAELETRAGRPPASTT
jgi:hypothetical protein